MVDFYCNNNQNDHKRAELSEGIFDGQDLNAFLNLDAPSTFVFEMTSQAMSDLGIRKGDFVVIKRGALPGSDSLVAVIMNKRFYLKRFADLLHQEEFADSKINLGKSEASLYGVVIGVFRRGSNLRINA